MKEAFRVSKTRIIQARMAVANGPGMLAQKPRRARVPNLLDLQEPKSKHQTAHKIIFRAD
jgi:hypothetical protein